jgi:superfamily II DNA/RNA helicase
MAVIFTRMIKHGSRQKISIFRPSCKSLSMFSEFGFSASVMEGINAMGYETPTPVQQQAIPRILKDKDLIACAQTGTGKTAAYLLPLMEKMLADRSHSVKTLIIVPTRELALQIDQQAQGMGYFSGISSISVYGGSDASSFEQEKTALSEGADIVIATPGRLLSHLNLGYVKFGQVRHLVLDEADRMLDMGFYEDIFRITTHLPKQRQTLMFSATMPPQIRNFASQLLHQPEQINIAVSKPAEGVLQGAYLLHSSQKNRLIVHLLKEQKIKSVIIFVSTRAAVKILAKDLQSSGVNAKAIHSDLEQSEREEVLRMFRNKLFPVLVATDVMSRGIDIEDIGLVINYDVPPDAEDYVHRVGRTARAESTGVALTLISTERQKKDTQYFQRIEKLIGYEVKKLPLPPSIGEPVYTKSNHTGHSKKYRRHS